MTSPCSLLPEACLQFGEGELRNGFWQRLPPTLLLTLTLVRKVLQQPLRSRHSHFLHASRWFVDLTSSDISDAAAVEIIAYATRFHTCIESPYISDQYAHESDQY
jgi:hypothetical protein